MKLTMTAREGHFNLLDPREKSISVHMRIGDKYVNLHFDCDERLVDYIDDPQGWSDTAIRLIDRFNKRVISTSNKEATELKEIILQNQKEIDISRLKEVIEEKRKKMLRLGDEIGGLEKEVLELVQQAVA